MQIPVKYSDSYQSKINNLASTQAKLDAILLKKLEDAYHKTTSKVYLQNLARIAHEHSPVDLAYASAYLPPNVHPIIYENLPDLDAKVSFVVHSDSDTRVNLFRLIDFLELKNLFDQMPTEDAIWILEDMSERRFRKLMELIDPEKALEIQTVKQHDRRTASRLMRSDYFIFMTKTTLKEVASYVRDHPRIDVSNGIFVVNEAGELQGYVPARNLIVNPQDLTLAQVMRPIVHKVQPDTSREEVIDIVERYQIASLPVVDIDNYLVGIITHEDVVEAMEDAADETLAQMSGTGEKVANEAPIFKRFLVRAPWLIVTLFAGLVNVSIMSMFPRHEDGLLTFVLFFVPLITGMSGNIGLQCSTILVRGMATGQITPSNKKQIMIKELVGGLFTGLLFGVFCGLLVYIIDMLSGGGLNADPIAVSTIITMGLIGACFAGTILGVSSPVFFSHIGVDPAIASGPIVTALNDFLSMTIYFLIAWGLGGFFFI